MNATYDQLDLIGDELHFDGMLVAIMTDNVHATHRGRFEILIRHGEEEGSDEDEDESSPAVDPDVSVEERVLDALWSDATDKAKGGLLRMGDLANIIARLKEDT